jgi:hypothetical protein
MIPSLDAETWLVARVKAHITGIFDGATDPSIRKDRMRRVLRDNGLDCVIAGNKNGKPETYAEVFRRLYGEAL